MSWVAKTEIPGDASDPSTSVKENGAAGIGDQLYVTGGYLADEFGLPVTDATWSYDEPSDTWTSTAVMPAERATHGCAAVNGKVYVAGGRDQSDVTKNTLFEYNPGTDTWATKATMPSARRGAAAVGIGTKLYVIGGSDATATLRDTLYVWDQGTNTWSALSTMPVALWLMGAAAVGTDIYVFGGQDATPAMVDTVYKYDTLTDSWSTLGTMPVADVLYNEAVARGTDVLICGGQASGIDDPAGGNLDKSTLYSYDTLSDTWTTLDPLPVFRWTVANAGTDSYFYVIGGWSGSQTYNTLYRWTASGGDGGPSDGGCVRAIRSSSDADEWWAGDGSATSGVATAFPTDRFTYAGGAVGSLIFYLSIDDDAGSQWWVDEYDASRATVLDRWAITSWTSAAAATPYYSAFSDIQHLTANATHVVVFAEAESDGLGTGVDSIDVAVFDLTGTIVDQWSITGPDRISGFTGSCLDAAGSLYFGRVEDGTFDEKVTSVDTWTGTATDLFTINDVDTAIIALDGSWSGLGATFGIVEIDGDLIIAGAAGIARVQQDGSPVWWQPLIDDSSFGYYALAHSGRGSVWAANSGVYSADEFQYDGTYVQTIAIPEPAVQAWLGPCAAQRGGWTFGIRF